MTSATPKGQRLPCQPQNCFTCRTSRQGSGRRAKKTTFALRLLATELLHLPDQPAGVGDKREKRLFAPRLLARELLHLPDQPAGVGQPVLCPRRFLRVGGNGLPFVWATRRISTRKIWAGAA
jgi:hypothetical protein